MRASSRLAALARPVRLTAALAAVALAASASLTLAAAAPAGAAPRPVTRTGYVKNGSYQFASNYTDGSTYPFVVSNSPFSYTDASQSLGSRGVTLSATGSAYASSAVIVPLGLLSSLFSSNGKYQPPVINWSTSDGATLLYNLYFDTNGNSTYFGWGTHDPYSYTGMDGDNAACMGNANNGQDKADFTCFSGESAAPGGPALTGVMTMEAVKTAFAARTDQTGAAYKNPMVWAWVGVQTTPDQVATVSSVDGTPLVHAVAPKHPSVLAARWICNGSNGRHWLVRVTAGSRSRQFWYYVYRWHRRTRNGSHRWYVYQGTGAVAPYHPVTVVTRDGSWLKVHYYNGYGAVRNTYARPGRGSC